MAIHGETPKTTTIQTHLTTTFWWPNPRRILLRRRKLPALRLGGKKSGKKGILTLLRKVRRIKWLKLRYSCMLRKLKKYYRSLLKDIVDSGATIEAYQQRLLMEASLAVPVMGFNFYPSLPGSNHPRSIFM